MKMTIAALAAVLLTCAPAAAQNIATLPTAAPLTGAEKLPALQGTGCPTRTNPCTTVAVTPAQVATYIGTTSQPADADLTAIAALATQSFGRSLLTQTDAATARATLGITAGGSGTVTSFAFTNGAGVSGTVTNPGTTPTLALTLGAITPTSVAATGTVTGSNLTGTHTGTSSGTNTGDQASVTGNAGTATTLATGRTLAITGDLAWTSPAFNGSGNVTAAGTLATVNANVGSFTNANITVDAKGRVTAAANGAAGGGGSGTVTSVSVTTANGVSGAVANSTTTPAISLTLGAITPTSVSATSTVAGSNITTAGNTIGNAASATKLLTARTIAGSSFDGTANITIADTALTGTAWTTYTPTITCLAGAPTTASANGRYKQIGKTVFVQVRIALTNNGTCATAVNFTLPSAVVNTGNSADLWVLAGRENALTGSILQGVLTSGTSVANVFAFNNSYPGGTGAVLALSGSYEAS